ncbi:MAG TPA: glycosyltransferase family 1 protein [Thermoflexales bacterium]|nr:glycosyltransferase family 1 protein [Thermoflexales bacterium]
MKIAVNAWFYESLHTGSGQYLRHLVEALRQLAPEIQLELVTPRKRDDLSKIKFEQSDFPRAAQRMKADLAFVPYWAPPLACAVPLVVTIHDIIPLVLPEYRGKAQHRLYTSLVRATSANAAAILTDSEHSRADIIARLGVPAERVSAIPLAADARFSQVLTEAEAIRVTEKYNLPEKYVFYLGGFDPRKNIETLLQVYVWAGIAIGDEYPLVVSGSPDERVAVPGGKSITLSEMARQLEVDDCVRFIGRADEADKPALYAMSRAFLYPSRYEGFGLNPLEAMSSGVPVVGSNASSLPEVVGDGGWLVDPADARRMAGALIATCVEDELHDRLAQRAVLHAAKFSWQRAAYETLAVFNRVMNAR